MRFGFSAYRGPERSLMMPSPACSRPMYLMMTCTSAVCLLDSANRASVASHSIKEALQKVEGLIQVLRKGRARIFPELLYLGPGKVVNRPAERLRKLFDIR